MKALKTKTKRISLIALASIVIVNVCVVSRRAAWADDNGLRGTKTPVFLQINRTSGFTGNVTITPPDFPGISPKPHEPISTSSDQVKFKLKIKASAAVGHLSLTFTGADDAGHTATATVTVIVE